MHVFITGGTGLIGSAVVAELLGNGRTVLALARSDASALAVEAAGATAIRGALADLDTLRDGVAQTDGVIHLAFGNDFSSPEALGLDPVAWTPRKRGCSLWDVHVGGSLLSTKTKP
jgi:uncharacterized protein YbjT (DUF2867 family)